MKTSQYVPELARGVPRSLGSRDCGAHQSQEGKGPERHTHSQSPPLGQWKPRRGKEETDQICVSVSSAEWQVEDGAEVKAGARRPN